MNKFELNIPTQKAIFGLMNIQNLRGNDMSNETHNTKVNCKSRVGLVLSLNSNNLFEITGLEIMIEGELIKKIDSILFETLEKQQEIIDLNGFDIKSDDSVQLVLQSSSIGNKQTFIHNGESYDVTNYDNM